MQWKPQDFPLDLQEVILETRSRIVKLGHVGWHEGHILTTYPENSPISGGSMIPQAMNPQVCEQTSSSQETIKADQVHGSFSAVCWILLVPPQ